MPRSSAIRTPELLDLIEQIRYSSRATLLRQIDRAEALAAELDPLFAYPLSFIVQRITGYRPRSTATHAGDPLAAVVPGHNLFADLSALVERLCTMAALTPDDLPPGSLSADALALRWSVARRTVERYRRQGLVARRLTHPSRAVTIAFTPAAIRAFESANHERLALAARFSRIDHELARRIIHQAHRLQRRLGWSHTAIINHLAARHHRARQSIAALLARGSADAPPLHLPIRHPLDPARRDQLIAEHQRGEPNARLAARFAISTSGVPRIIAEHTAATIAHAIDAWTRDLAIDHEPPDAVAALLELDTESLRATPRHATAIAAPWPEDMPALIAAAETARPLHPELERERATLSLAIPLQVRHAIAALRGRSPTATRADQWATALRHASMLKQSLAHALLGVAIRAANERIATPIHTLPPAEAARIAHETTLALGQAIDRFALGHGQRAAAQVSLLIPRRLQPFPLHQHPTRSNPRARAAARLHPHAPALAPWAVPVLPAPPIRAILLRRSTPLAHHPAADDLDHHTLAALAVRWGLTDAAPITLESLAQQLNITRRKAAELERQLRHAAAATTTSATTPDAPPAHLAQ